MSAPVPPPGAAGPPPARRCAEPGCGDWGTHGYGWDPLKVPPIEGNWWCAAHDPHARSRAAEKAAPEVAPPPGPRVPVREQLGDRRVIEALIVELRDIPEGPEIRPSAQGRLL